MQTTFGGRVVLTDFGFANHIDQRSGRLKSRLGTEGFIAPEVKFVDSLNGGYTMKADMWSLGVLTACLHTGHTLVLKDEVMQLSQQQIADRYLAKYQNFTCKRWLHERPRALQFLRRLLIVDPAKRMSAAEALNHAWFTEPKTEAAMIEIGYQKVIRFWKQCNRNDDVLEYISVQKKHNQDSQKAKSGRNSWTDLPDTTLSPYFGLDRHLKEKWTRKQSKTLDDFNRSHFVTPTISQFPHRMREKSTKIEREMATQFEIGGDIFTSTSTNQIPEPNAILESSQLPVHKQYISEKAFQKPDEILTESQESHVTTAVSRKHFRTKSEELKYHEEITESILDYCSSVRGREETKLKKRRTYATKNHVKNSFLLH
ncbi:hypothetical protein K3495_g1224 [Podosphaera aphanis]|nr:hypothetical protein K3495_g1224 [Podosphaera aphanis]